VSEATSQVQYRTCNLCETMCGIAVEHDGENILSIKGDADNVLSKGNICAKAVGLQDIHVDPDRLKKPIKKIDGEWIEISWDDAFDEVAEQLASIQNKYGKNALATYYGRSVAHNIGALLMVHPVRRIFDTQNTSALPLINSRITLSGISCSGISSCRLSPILSIPIII